MAVWSLPLQGGSEGSTFISGTARRFSHLLDTGEPPRILGQNRASELSSSAPHFGEQRALRFREKGGKVREIPVRHDLDAWLRAYLDVAGIIGQDDKMPLFRAADDKRRQLTAAAYRAHSMRQMLKRRLEDAGLPHLFSPHSFRVAVVTDLLNQNVPLEDVQYLAGHSNPRTTQIYDRRRRRITRNIVERIWISIWDDD
jgi:integrase/recombinase XerD